MAGSQPDKPSKGKEGSQRLGTLSADGDLPAGRLGALRMASSAEASTSQSGQTAAATARKGKFKPTVVARRKREDLATASASASAVSNDAFKDLIKAAQSEAGWQQRGRGRGLGRGRGRQSSYQVVFGGGSSQGVQASFGVRAAAGAGGNGAAGASEGRKRIVKAGDVAGPSAGGVKHEELFGNGSERPKLKHSEGVLNYSQYYPTMLPLRMPDEEGVEEAEENAAPPDLAQMPEAVGNVAKRLGLLNTDEHSEQLMLFQLPPLLPIPVPADHHAKPESSRARALRGEEPRPAPLALQLKDLPSGKIGKLLVFESGKVKMQIGEVLLDVSEGMPCHFRQDVAVINSQAGHCVFLGDVAQRVVCSPDVEQLLSDAPVPKYQHAKSAAQPNGKHALSAAVKGEDGGLADMSVDVKAEEQNGHAEPAKHSLSRLRRKAIVDDDEEMAEDVHQNGALQ
ncbi:hypothetical protein WJX72_000813 [[Myrmecia] bisecta]|uniref:DNA-directed RNA polymerase III subunit RPC4 n=1 Tax=[Myrmecia] bisecta TaxID=41462 RepID=A0AAW1R3M9_9CHLO